MIESDYFLIILASFFSAGLSIISIPTIVHIAQMKNLCAAPTDRGAHRGWIPNLGGVAIFASFMIIMNLLSKDILNQELQYINVSIVILFLLGIKDDILVIDPVKKFLGQLLVAVLLAYFADIRLTNLHGFLGIYELNYWVDLFLSIFVILLIINAYNLIDGIDGLASGIALVGVGSFTVWFIVNEFYFFSLLGFVMIGSLSVFLYFNLYSKKFKLFLGDTGAMIVGFIVSVMAIKFIQLSVNPELKWALDITPSIAFGILAIPICDVFRVFVIRLINKKSPFKADRKHIHHLMIDMGYSHSQASFRIILMNILIVLLCYIGREWNGELLFIAIVTTVIFAKICVFYISKKKANIILKSKKTV